MNPKWVTFDCFGTLVDWHTGFAPLLTPLAGTRTAFRLLKRPYTRCHPSLRFKKLQGGGEIWSVRINEQYRAVGVRSGDTIE